MMAESANAPNPESFQRAHLGPPLPSETSVVVLGGSGFLLVLVPAAALKTSRATTARARPKGGSVQEPESAQVPLMVISALNTNSDGLRAAPQSHRGTVANTVNCRVSGVNALSKER
jgi:hypothetical protein